MTTSMSIPRSGPRLLRTLWPALLALALAWLARHLVVEPAAYAHACDPSPWAGWCAARTAIIRTFVHQEIGWLALAAGIAATVWRRRWLARVALAAGAAGLVLYSFEPSAVGALLGALVLARASGQAEHAANTHSRPA